MKTRGIDWQEFKQELLTEEERREIEDKASLMCANQAILDAESDIKAGKISGPFKTVGELMSSLNED